MPDASERHLRVKVSDKTIESLWFLQVHHGLTRSELIERLIDDAVEAMRREIAARPKPTPLTEREPVTDEDDEPDGGSRPTLDADGRWQPWWKT